MNTKVIALFGVSVTAGSCYLVYTQVKSQLIKRLVKTWLEAATKAGKTLDEKVLTTELDKLYAWDVQLLATLSKRYIAQTPKEDMAPLIQKVRKRQIFKQADLSSAKNIGFPA